MIRRGLLALALAATPQLAVTAPPAPGEVACPETIATEQSATPVEGWTQSENNTRRDGNHLEAVLVWEGPPGERVSRLLGPDKNEDKEIWRTAGWTLPPSPKGYWLQCIYNSTRISLERPLPPAIRSCEAEYDQHWGGSILRTMICKP